MEKMPTMHRLWAVLLPLLLIVLVDAKPAEDEFLKSRDVSERLRRQDLRLANADSSNAGVSYVNRRYKQPDDLSARSHQDEQPAAENHRAFSPFSFRNTANSGPEKSSPSGNQQSKYEFRGEDESKKSTSADDQRDKSEIIGNDEEGKLLAQKQTSQARDADKKDPDVPQSLDPNFKGKQEFILVPRETMEALLLLSGVAQSGIDINNNSPFLLRSNSPQGSTDFSGPLVAQSIASPTVVTQARINQGLQQQVPITPQTFYPGLVPWAYATPQLQQANDIESRQFINGLQALFPVFTINLSNGATQVSTRAQFPQPNSGGASGTFVDGPATPTVTGRIYMFQPSSSGRTWVEFAVTGLQGGTTYTLQLYTASSVGTQCASLTSKYTAGGTGLLKASFTPTGATTAAVPYAEAFTVDETVMTLVGANTAAGRSVAIEEQATGTIVACAPLVSN